MNGIVTLQHLITHSLQEKYFDNIEDFYWRKAIKALRQHHTLNDFFSYIPKALIALKHKPHYHLANDWQGMMQTPLGQYPDLTFDNIQKPLLLQLKTQFFVSICYHTLAWQKQHLNDKIKQNTDIAIQTYYVMSYLQYIEELLSLNQKLLTKENAIRHYYTLCMASQWLTLYYTHKPLIISTSLSYQADEVEQYLQTNPEHSTLHHVAKQLIEAINIQKTQTLDEEELFKHQEKIELDNYKKEIHQEYDKQMISSKEAADILGKSESTITRYRQGNKINYKMDGKSYRYYKEEIELLAKDKARKS